MIQKPWSSCNGDRRPQVSRRARRVPDRGREQRIRGAPPERSFAEAMSLPLAEVTLKAVDQERAGAYLVRSLW